MLAKYISKAFDFDFHISRESDSSAPYGHSSFPAGQAGFATGLPKGKRPFRVFEGKRPQPGTVPIPLPAARERAAGPAGAPSLKSIPSRASKSES